MSLWGAFATQSLAEGYFFENLTAKFRLYFGWF